MSGLFASVVFRGTFPLWAAVVAGIVLTAAAFAFYFSETMRLNRGRRVFLSVLRAAILAAILFLICKPVWVRDLKTERIRPVAMMVDNSQSMTQADPRLTAADRGRAAIALGLIDPTASVLSESNEGLSVGKPTRRQIVEGTLGNQKLGFFNNVRKVGPLQPYLIGSRIRAFSDDPESKWLKELSAEDTKTLLADSLAEVLKRDPLDLPSAILVMSDGRENGSEGNWEDLAREAKRLNVPIHVYGVGGSAIGFLQLKEAGIQDTLFVQDTVNVPFRWRVQGIKDGEVELTVTIRGNVVASKRVPVKDGENLSETLSFTPTKEDVRPEKQEVVASIKLIRGTETLEDRVAKSVRVVDRKVKMLYVENNPRWEFKFMQRAFMRDRRVDPTFIVIGGDRRAMESGIPYLPNFPDQRKDLFQYDLLVVGDVDANYFTAEQRIWIKDFVAEGGGLICIAGRLNAPASWINTPLADVLPVEFPALKFPAEDARRPSEFRPNLSELGRRNTMFSLADDPLENRSAWDGLPGFFWHYPVTKLRPAAVSLMDHPKEKIAEDRPMPLIATHYYGKGLVMFCGVEETWRWRYNEGDKYFGRYWGQVVYAMGLPHTLGTKSGQLAIAGGEAVLGKPGRIHARLFTPDFLPRTDERIVTQVERLDAGPTEERFRMMEFQRVPNQPGEYVAAIANDRAGQFAVKVDSGSEKAELTYRVTLPAEHELSPGSMNEDGLRTLAESTGGKFMREEDLHRIADVIEKRTVTISQRQETLLWTEWWVLVLVVGLFTVEWVIRKFSNMS